MKNMIRDYVNYLKFSLGEIRKVITLTLMLFLLMIVVLYVLALLLAPGILILIFVTNKVAAYIVFAHYVLLIWIPLVVSFFSKMKGEDYDW